MSGSSSRIMHSMRNIKEHKLLCISAVMAVLLGLICIHSSDHSLHYATLSFPINSSFRGTLNIAIEVGSQTTTVTMNLNEGRGSTSARVQSPTITTAHCGYFSDHVPTQRLVSPDKQAAISCSEIYPLVVARMGQSGQRKRVSERSQMWDAVWSPDSRSIAILVEEPRYEWLTLRGMVSLVTSLGPAQLVHYRVFLFSPGDSAFEELPFPYEKIDGELAILEWSRP
jgi:hypothetical protein